MAELTHCSSCLGALPPDVDGACSVCGSGTVTVVMEQGTFTPTGPLDSPLGYTVIDEEHTFTEQQLVEAVAAPPRRSWWERFARWPNA